MYDLFLDCFIAGVTVGAVKKRRAKAAPIAKEGAKKAAKDVPKDASQARSKCMIPTKGDTFTILPGRFSLGRFFF